VEQVDEIVTEINREGTTVLVIEQDVALALSDYLGGHVGG
jgi:ABC-type branched-subunit amino acid transport system ATPase component